jgi:hypothetical protein
MSHATTAQSAISLSKKENNKASGLHTGILITHENKLLIMKSNVTATHTRYLLNKQRPFLISNSRPVLNIVCFLLGNFPASECYMPTAYKILHTYPPMKMEQSVPKRRNIKFRRQGTTQKKAYNKQRPFLVLTTESCSYTQTNLYFCTIQN